MRSEEVERRGGGVGGCEEGFVVELGEVIEFGESREASRREMWWALVSKYILMVEYSSRF